MTTDMTEYHKTIQDNHMISVQVDIIVIFIIKLIHYICMATIEVLQIINHFDYKSFLRYEID